MLRRIFQIVFVTGTAFLTGTAQSWACSVCFGGTGDSVTDGFNTSVLFLMSTPYLVLGSIVGVLLLSYRRALKQREQTEEAERNAPIAELAWNQEESSR